MTCNRVQGLTLDRVALDLRADFFSHGQLYVALGRVCRREDILILTTKLRTLDETALCKNIVLPTILLPLSASPHETGANTDASSTTSTRFPRIHRTRRTPSFAAHVGPDPAPPAHPDPPQPPKPLSAPLRFFSEFRTSISKRLHFTAGFHFRDS